MSLEVKDLGRTRQPKAVRESDILAAAHAIFSVKGYEKTAMSEIAKGARVAEGTIYKHFANKQDVLAGVVSGFYKTSIEKAENSLAGIKGIENQLRVLITRHIQTFFEDTGLCRLLLQEIRPLNNYPHSDMHQHTRRYSEILLKVIDDGKKNNEIRTDIASKTVRDMIFGGLEHSAWNVLSSNKTTLDADSLTQDILSIVLNGLKPQPIDQYKVNLDRLEQLVTRLENNNK